jgi:hypothetical protein
VPPVKDGIALRLHIKITTLWADFVNSKDICAGSAKVRLAVGHNIMIRNENMLETTTLILRLWDVKDIRGLLPI